MGIVKEFREFAVKGNAMDLAVGIIIGAAFGKIVSSLVQDILMPPLSVVLGGADFSNLFVTLRPGPAPTNGTTLADAKAAGATTWNYGQFVNVLIEFLIVAFAVFLLVKGMNKLASKEPPPPPNTKDCPLCATAIPLAAKRCPHCTSDLAKA